MAKKPATPHPHQRPDQAGQRTLGESNPQRSEQARAKQGQVEDPVKDLSGNSRRNGRAMECVRIVFASDCKPCPDCGEPVCVGCNEHYAECECLGPDNAVEEGWQLAETEDGTVYAIRERPI